MAGRSEATRGKDPAGRSEATRGKDPAGRSEATRGERIRRDTSVAGQREQP